MKDISHMTVGDVTGYLQQLDAENAELKERIRSLEAETAALSAQSAEAYAQALRKGAADTEAHVRRMQEAAGRITGLLKESRDAENAILAELQGTAPLDAVRWRKMCELIRSRRFEFNTCAATRRGERVIAITDREARPGSSARCHDAESFEELVDFCLERVGDDTIKRMKGLL